MVQYPTKARTQQRWTWYCIHNFWKISTFCASYFI